MPAADAMPAADLSQEDTALFFILHDTVFLLRKKEIRNVFILELIPVSIRHTNIYHYIIDNK